MPDTPLSPNSDYEQSIRERIRAKLTSRQLSPLIGMLVIAPTEGGQICAACEVPLAMGDAMPHGYRYVDGAFHCFHVRCNALWEDERNTRVPLRR